jgi:hypothetical protein
MGMDIIFVDLLTEENGELISFVSLIDIEG